MALKQEPTGLRLWTLPARFREVVEPLVGATAANLAYAARNTNLDFTEAAWLLRQSLTVDSQDSNAHREQLETMVALGQSENALAPIDEQLAKLRTTEPHGPTWEREYRDWLTLRERCLRNLGRTDDVEQVRAEIFRAAAAAARPGSARLI